ncbi:integrase core domain protein [Aphelenchoides avenae]|nr:integrase core domain protein [Aphelenchus avenae]
MERRIPALDQELKKIQKVSYDVTSFGKKWMEDAAKHPQAAREEEVDKYEKLRTNHDVPSLIGRAADRVRELRQAISKMTRLYDKCHANFERQSGTVGARPRTVFPSAMGAFGATSSGGTGRRPGASSFNTSSSSATADDAYMSSFFKDGELELLIAKTPASDKQLKLVNQPIETFKGDITKFPIFRQQFLREAHRPGRDMDDTDRFTYLLSLLDGPAKQLVSGIKPLKGCYQLAVETLQQRYGNEDELYRHLLRELKQLKPLQTGCSAHQIEQFTMKVIQTLASIADLGRADTSGRTLEEMEEKIPPDLREKIQERRLNDPKWNVMKLHHFLMDRAAILRAIHGDQGRSSSQDTSKVKTAVTTSAQPRQEPKTVRFSKLPPNRDRVQTSAPKCVFCPST